MKRKLKKLLKDTYSAEPNRKYSFIQQLQSNPTWQKLHPISSMVRISSASVFIFATITTIALGTGLIAYNFRNDADNTEPTPENPPITVETTSCTTYTTITTTLKQTITTSATYTTITTTSSTSSSTSHSTNSTNTTTQTKINTTTTKSAETTTTTAIINTHLFKHDYTEDDLMHTSLDKLPGYPNRNMIPEALRLSMEMTTEEFAQFMLENDLSESDLSYEMLDFIISWDTPPIVEGETVNISYTAYEGKPWTICDIKLTEVYNFKKNKVLNKGDIIKIAMAGGYMPVSEYITLNPDDDIFSGWSDEQINATIIYEDGSNQIPPKTGDIYTYILNDNTKNLLPDFPVEDCFTRQSISDICQFRKNGDRFTSTNTYYSDFYFTMQQIEEYALKFRDTIQDPDSNRTIYIRDVSFLLSGEFEFYIKSMDGKLHYLGNGTTDDGFYPFADKDNYNIIWTDSGIIVEYRFENNKDYFKKEEFAYPKE